MPQGTVDTLLSVINKGGGFVAPNYFDVKIPMKGIVDDQQTYTVLSASVPSRDVQVGEYSPGTPTKKFVHGVQDEDVTIVFRLTNDFAVYDICMDWIEEVANPRLYRKAYKNEVAADTFIMIMDKQHNVNKQFKLRNSFPINISNIELNNESESQIATFGITLTYDYFERMN